MDVDNCIKNGIECLTKALEENTKKAKAIREEIQDLRDQCKHKDLDIDECGTATCNICGKRFSWYCPTSPTLECDYEQLDGSYDDDSCRYCGEPEERKWVVQVQQINFTNKERLDGYTR